MDTGNTKLIIGTTRSRAEELAKKVPRAHVVLTFNTIPVKCCSEDSNPKAKKLGRAWCTVATTRMPKMSLPS